MPLKKIHFQSGQNITGKKLNELQDNILNYLYSHKHDGSEAPLVEGGEIKTDQDTNPLNDTIKKHAYDTLIHYSPEKEVQISDTLSSYVNIGLIPASAFVWKDRFWEATVELPAGLYQDNSYVVNIQPVFGGGNRDFLKAINKTANFYTLEGVVPLNNRLLDYTVIAYDLKADSFKVRLYTLGTGMPHQPLALSEAFGLREGEGKQVSSSWSRGSDDLIRTSQIESLFGMMYHDGDIYYHGRPVKVEREGNTYLIYQTDILNYLSNAGYSPDALSSTLKIFASYYKDKVFALAKKSLGGQWYLIVLYFLGVDSDGNYLFNHYETAIGYNEPFFITTFADLIHILIGNTTYVYSFDNGQFNSIAAFSDVGLVFPVPKDGGIDYVIFKDRGNGHLASDTLLLNEGSFYQNDGEKISLARVFRYEDEKNEVDDTWYRKFIFYDNEGYFYYAYARFNEGDNGWSYWFSPQDEPVSLPTSKEVGYEGYYAPRLAFTGIQSPFADGYVVYEGDENLTVDPNDDSLVNYLQGIIHRENKYCILANALIENGDYRAGLQTTNEVMNNLGFVYITKPIFYDEKTSPIYSFYFSPTMNSRRKSTRDFVRVETTQLLTGEILDYVTMCNNYIFYTLNSKNIEDGYITVNLRYDLKSDINFAGKGKRWIEVEFPYDFQGQTYKYVKGVKYLGMIDLASGDIKLIVDDTVLSLDENPIGNLPLNIDPSNIILSSVAIDKSNSQFILDDGTTTTAEYGNRLIDYSLLNYQLDPTTGYLDVTIKLPLSVNDLSDLETLSSNILLSVSPLTDIYKIGTEDSSGKRFILNYKPFNYTFETPLIPFHGLFTLARPPLRVNPPIANNVKAVYTSGGRTSSLLNSVYVYEGYDQLVEYNYKYGNQSVKIKLRTDYTYYQILSGVSLNV